MSQARNPYSLTIDSISLTLIVLSASLFLFLGLQSPATTNIGTFLIAFMALGIGLMMLTSGVKVADFLTNKVAKKDLLYFGGCMASILVFNFAISALPLTIASLVPAGNQATEISVNIAAVEEIWFRGFMLPFLAHRFGRFGGIVGSAGLWATYHVFTGDPISSLAVIFLIGIVFAFADLKTNSILPSLAAHLVNNALAVGL